jgi:hypothetical protein
VDEVENFQKKRYRPSMRPSYSSSSCHQLLNEDRSSLSTASSSVFIPITGLHLAYIDELDKKESLNYSETEYNEYKAFCAKMRQEVRKIFIKLGWTYEDFVNEEKKEDLPLTN